jgi:hypothetical protein
MNNENNPEDLKLKELFKWGTQNKAYFNKIEVKYLSINNRYVVASEAISVYQKFTIGKRTNNEYS